MAVVSVLVLALLDWSGNDITSVAAFQQGTANNYAMNSAMENAIQQVRYSTTACPSTGLSFPGNNLTIQVWCNPNPGNTTVFRQIQFTACSSSAVSAGTCSSSSPYLTVVATFDDYAPSFPLGSSVPCSATCGTTMRINSWVFRAHLAAAPPWNGSLVANINRGSFEGRNCEAQIN